MWNPLLVVPLQAVGTVLLADFVSGVVHWAEDAYARADTPVIGKLVGAANLEHHLRPRAFLARSWWQSSRKTRSTPFTFRDKCHYN